MWKTKPQRHFSARAIIPGLLTKSLTVTSPKSQPKRRSHHRDSYRRGSQFHGALCVHLTYGQSRVAPLGTFSPPLPQHTYIWKWHQMCRPVYNHSTLNTPHPAWSRDHTDQNIYTALSLNHEIRYLNFFLHPFLPLANISPRVLCL